MEKPKGKQLQSIAIFITLLFGLSGCNSKQAITSSSKQEESSDPTSEESSIDPKDMTPSELLDYYYPPALQDKSTMLDILQREEYGYLPPAPSALSFETLEENIKPDVCVGKAVVNKMQANLTIYDRNFSFVFYETMPIDGQKHPFFIHLNFRDDIPDRYLPIEYLVDEGFAVLSLCYLDVTSDNNDFTNGLAGVIFHDGERNDTDPGKIALWAWAAHRVMDYAETKTSILDLTHAIVCGHSRLGKTALLAAATDTRFTHGFSNDAGCSGDALARAMFIEDGNETVNEIVTRFPHWFCKNYYKYADREETMPFDQHYLIASVSPRLVLLGSANEDIWANPKAQQLSALAASPAFNNGFVAPDRFANVNESFLTGDIGFYKREGEHFFKEEDWSKLIEFINLHN